MKALHPAALHKSPAIPDHSLAQVVLPDFRSSVVVSAPPAVTGAWDLCVVQTPGDAIGLWWASGPAGVDFTAHDIPANCVRGAILVQPGEWLPPLQMRNTATGGVVNYSQQALESAPWAWRRRYGGMTAYMTASALVDQGTVYAASFPSEYTDGSMSADYAFLSPAPSSTALLVIESRTNVPLDENALQLVSPKPFVAPARHGAYVPQRWLGADPTFVKPRYPGNPLLFDSNSGDFVGVGAVTTGGWTEGTLPVIPVVTSNYATADGASAWFGSWPVSLAGAAAGQSLAAGLAPILDTGMSPHSTGVIIFRGLANAASITLKSMLGLEVVPRADSTQRQFAVPPGPGSDEAIALYTRVCSQLDPAYSASYNALGALLPVIASLVRTYGPPLVRSIFAAPVVRRRAQPDRMAEYQRVALSDPRAPAMSEMSVGTPRARRRRRRRGGRRSSVAGTPRSVSRPRTPRARIVSSVRRIAG